MRFNTARITGIWYLLLAISGMVGFLVIRSRLYVDNHPDQTIRNLLENPQLAHVGVGVELAVVATQTLAAFWFFKLFLDVHRMAAYAVLLFGMLNSVAILISAIALSTLVRLVEHAQGAAIQEMSGAVSLLLTLSASAWSLGGLTFGLWLIPMGLVALQFKRFPQALGWILLIGSAGYVCSAFLGQVWMNAPKVVLDLLTIPATIGEFWMVGYLLSKGMRPEDLEG